MAIRRLRPSGGEAVLVCRGGFGAPVQPDCDDKSAREALAGNGRGLFASAYGDAVVTSALNLIMDHVCSLTAAGPPTANACVMTSRWLER